MIILKWSMGINTRQCKRLIAYNNQTKIPIFCDEPADFLLLQEGKEIPICYSCTPNNLEAMIV